MLSLGSSLARKGMLWRSQWLELQQPCLVERGLVIPGRFEGDVSVKYNTR